VRTGVLEFAIKYIQVKKNMSERKTILITGSRKGIGRGLAEHYLAQGWQVAGCSRKPAELEHRDYHHFTLNVTDEQAVAAMLNQIKRDLGGLTALVNCAGIARMNPALLTPTGNAEKIMNTNFIGTFVCSREAAKLMMGQGSGRIVNFSTVAVPLALAGEALYSASKAAVEQFTRSLARELGGYGITVNTVGPNPIQTEMIANVPPEKLEQLVARQAVARYGKIEDVTNVIDFFLRQESNLITGQTIYLGGPP